ncbi:MAG: hypothetical protein MUE81_02650 [Thermoflexibacter sp.]|nr:hypothetical protein [Thermoflexibacter sp.]
MKASLWTFISVCIRISFNFIINKLFAIYFGSAGMTLLAHFQNLLSFATAFVGEGLNKGVIKYLSDKHLADQERKIFFVVGGILNVFIFVCACLITLLNHKNFAQFMGNFPFHQWFLWLIIPLLVNLLNLFCLSVVQSQQKFKLFSFLNTLNIALSTALIFLSIRYQDISIALLAYNLGQGVSLLITVPLAWQILKNLFPNYALLTKQNLQNKIVKLNDFMAIGLSIVLFSRLGFYAMREFNMATFGMTQTGFWEASMRISDGYTFAFNATFLAIFYPRVSNLLLYPEQLKKYLWQTFQLLSPLILLSLLVVFWLKESFIILLFDETFLPATALVSWVIFGDFFKFINYLLSNVLIAQGRTWLFICLQGIFIGLSFILVYLLAPHFGLQSLPITWVSTYILSVVVLGIILRKELF